MEVAAEENVQPFPGFQPVAIRCLPQTQKLRYICLRMITNPWFERISIIVILINCVTLGMYRPCEDDENCSTTRCKILQIVDDCIFVFFAVEMCIKMVAMGIFGTSAYLADRWNWLDCFIVFSGLAEYCVPNVENVNLSAIRTIRVLRPLRAINRIPSMRILVMLLLDTLPMLGNVLLLCFFVFFIFGIIGVQLWAGILRQRCFLDLPENVTTEMSVHPNYRNFFIEKEYICSRPTHNGMHLCEGFKPYKCDGNDQFDCNLPAMPNHANTPAIIDGHCECVNWNQYYTDCRPGDKNPFQGAISFDNIGLAWVAIFLVISLEGWTEIMYYIQDAHSFWNWIYFVLLIVIGSFFMINLCLVVIATQFSETKKRELERMRIERARFTSTSTLTAIEHASCYSEIVKLIGHWVRKAKRKVQNQWPFRRRRPDNNEEHQIDLGVVRGDRQEELMKLEKESTRRPSGLTCPQLLALSGALNALPQVALGGAQVKGLPDWCEISSSLRRGQPLSFSAPILTLTTPTGSPKRAKEKRPRKSSSGSDMWISNNKQANLKMSPLRRKVKELVESKHFQKAILLAILINTFSMGVEYHEQPKELTDVVEISNFLFSGIFCIEMLLKVTAYGVVGYLSNGFNVFDGFIVIISGVELMQGIRSGNMQSGGALSVLRTFRLLRILKLVRFLPNLRRQLVVMLKTMDNVAVFFALLVLFIFIFSILGMNLFGCKFCVRDKVNDELVCERKNFDSLLWALVILTQEDWNIVLFNGMEKTSPWAALYFVALMTFGNYVLFNLLVAILVEGFSAERLEREQKEREAEERERADEGAYFQEEAKMTLELSSTPEPGPSSKLVPAPIIITHTAATPEVPSSADPLLMNDYDHVHSSPHPPIIIGSVSNLVAGSPAAVSYASLGSSVFNQPPHIDLCLPSISPNSLSPYSLTPPNSLSPQSLSPLPSPKRSPCLKRAKSWKEERDQRKKERRCSLSPNLKMNDRSHHNNNNIHSRFRQRCQEIVEYPGFDRFILLLIALNCITLAMERPSIPPDSIERYCLSIFNDLFTVLFLGEMSFKVIAIGGFAQYFKSGWNVMDGLLVIVSVIDQIISVFMSSPKIFGILRVFRLLRSLRPLRVINRAPGLKLVVQTLLSSLRPIGNIVLICCTFFIIFGILGVQLFKGTFYYCFGPNSNVTNKVECLRYEGNEWVNRKYNFDDLGQALMALFVLSCKDGWVEIMYSGLDAVGVDIQPEENHNEWRILYFISFLLLVGFFVLNMFVGVVVENFHRCREEQEKEERAEREIKRSRKLEKRRRKMRERPYWTDYGPTRLRIHSLVTSKYFDLAIAGVIGLNVVTMAMEFYKMPEELSYVLRMFNYFFTEVFILEGALKLIALGIRRYFSSKWNQLDLFIVVLSVVGIVLEKMDSDVIPINPTIMRVMRVLRIARVLKLLKMAGGIRALLDTVVQALPQVGNLGLLFFLLFFIFAALGVELFGKLACDDDHPCEGLGEHANFVNFGMAFLTLFRVATGDNWNGIMKDTLRDESKCDKEPDCVYNCCVNSVVAPLFFVVFVLMAQFVLVNVVVAVLMKHLEESHKQMEDDLDIEAELEAELAAQEEIMAKLEEEPPRTFFRLPKVSSLPDNFCYSYFDSTDADSNLLSNSTTVF